MLIDLLDLQYKFCDPAERCAIWRLRKLDNARNYPVRPGDIIITPQDEFLISITDVEELESVYSPYQLKIWKAFAPYGRVALIPANYWCYYTNRAAFNHHPYKDQILANLSYTHDSMATYFKIGRQICWIKSRTKLANAVAYVKTFKIAICSLKPLLYTVDKSEKWTIYIDLF